MQALHGGCLCGRVTFSARGEPLRVGICPCTDWSGETSAYGGRRFCPDCGSRLFAVDDGEAEVKLGALAAAPTRLTPTYELWVKRREAWLKPIDGAEQFVEDRR